MVICKWEELPENMKTSEVQKYYDTLSKHKLELVFKRFFDFIVAFLLLIILALPMLVIGLVILIDSPGGIFYRQERVTTNGKVFKIHKYRTMYKDSDKGSKITVDKDRRITKVGAFLRRYRLDELPQLFDVLNGDMSFVGTRPEVPQYVREYTKEMMATLLLPAGITSEASIQYKDEAMLLNQAENVDQVYIEKVLPGKMVYNLRALEHFSLWREIMTMIRTVLAVVGIIR